MRIIELEHSTLELSPDNIVIIRCKEDHFYELNEVIEITEAAGELTNKKKMPTLTVPGKYSDASKEALEFIFSPDSAQYASADAYIVRSLSQKIIGNFYLRLRKTDVPTRLFTSEKTALEWLKKQSVQK